MNKLRTCVVTVNYRGAQDTLNCIQSLRKSSVPVSIVIVDNTPQDPELELCLANCDDVKIIRAETNLGFGMGTNLGIQWALENTDCEFIFIFNNDAMVLENSIELLEASMDRQQQVGVASPKIVMADDPDILWYGGGEVDWRRGAAIAPGISGRSDASLAITPRPVSFASGCAMLIRRTVIEQLGMFSDYFFMYEEDLELCLRISKAGVLIWYEPSSTILHVCQGSMRKDHKFMGLWSPKNPNLSFYVYHIVRNRLINAFLHARGRNLLLFLFFFPLLNIYKLMQFVMHGRWDGVKSLVAAWFAFVRFLIYEQN